MQRGNWIATICRPGIPNRIRQALRLIITCKGRLFVRYPTPKVSSSSLKVFWLNRKETTRRLQIAMKALKERHPEIGRAVLFGSLERGDAVPGSDADVLVVLSATDLTVDERAAVYRPEGVGIPVDLFVYTRTELDGMLADGNRFVGRALAEGRDLL